MTQTTFDYVKVTKSKSQPIKRLKGAPRLIEDCAEDKIMREERPITFTISAEENGYYRMFTKDGRVDEFNRDVRFPKDQLFAMMGLASGIYNNKGFAVLFEVD